jgi:tRNA(Arg) A34 adenosine deaminase TadA
MFSQAQTIQIVLPSWLEPYAQSYSHTLDHCQQMDFVIKASQKNIEAQTGGPFAAAIFESTSGKLVSLGVNIVTNQNLSILHAEMVAISLAQYKLNTYNLSANAENTPYSNNHQWQAYHLVTSTEPCAMCLGAIPWSGVQAVISGASAEDAEAIGFDEGAKPEDWVKTLETRGIQVTKECQQTHARSVLNTYEQKHGPIYNTKCL